MDKLQAIKNYASSLGLTHTKKELESLIHEAEQKQSSYISFIEEVLSREISYRQDRVLSGKLIAAPNCKLKQTFWNQPLLKQSHCLRVIQHDI